MLLKKCYVYLPNVKENKMENFVRQIKTLYAVEIQVSETDIITITQSRFVNEPFLVIHHDAYGDANAVAVDEEQLRSFNLSAESIDYTKKALGI